MGKKIKQAAPLALNSDIFTDLEAAAYLRVKPRTLRLWRQTRGLPHIKITSKEIRYRRPDLDAWLARHSVAIAA